MKWKLVWRGNEPPGRDDDGPGCRLTYNCHDEFIWWNLSAPRADQYVAVVPNEDLEQAWQAVEGRCNVAERLDAEEVADDWQLEVRIGYKGIRVRHPSLPADWLENAIAKGRSR
jgi:hypothetical protein